MVGYRVDLQRRNRPSSIVKTLTNHQNSASWSGFFRACLRDCPAKRMMFSYWRSVKLRMWISPLSGRFASILRR